MWKLSSESGRLEILIPAQVVAEAVDADCLPAELRDALIRGVSVREDVCTGMRPWLMVLGAFAAAAGGAFIAIANERRRRLVVAIIALGMLAFCVLWPPLSLQASSLLNLFLPLPFSFSLTCQLQQKTSTLRSLHQLAMEMPYP